MLGQQLDVEGDGNENVPLYNYINDNIQIQFGREQFCLVTGLRFEVENLADYNDGVLPIPFKRWVFLSYFDGEHIISHMVFRIIDDELFDRLHDDDIVSLCCLGILQLVLLGMDGKRRIVDWMLRLANDIVGRDNYPWPKLYSQLKNVWQTLYSQLKNANVRHWPKLYATQPTTEINKKSYSIFGYTWAFKGGPSSFQTHPNNISFFNIGTPTNWQTPMSSQPGPSNWQSQILTQSATPYWQPTFLSYPGTYNWQSPIPSHMEYTELKKREQRPSVYKRTPYMEQPPTTVLPKQCGNKNKNNVMKANLSPLNLGNAFDDENERGDDIIFLGGQFTGNYLVYENMDPKKVKR
nr:hypothetical protein [Tanacetum cinerariifolium]